MNTGSGYEWRKTAASMARMFLYAGGAAGLAALLPAIPGLAAAAFAGAGPIVGAVLAAGVGGGAAAALKGLENFLKNRSRELEQEQPPAP